MNEDKNLLKDNKHFKTFGGALLSLILIVLFGIVIMYLIGVFDNNDIDFLGFLFLVLEIIDKIFPCLTLILLIGIFHRLRKNN